MEYSLRLKWLFFSEEPNLRLSDYGPATGLIYGGSFAIQHKI